MATTKARYVVTEDIPERSSWCYSATLLDEDGDAIPLASISTLTLTIYNLDTTYTIVNSVDGTDIKNTGRGTIGTTSGLLEIRFLPADSQMLDSSRAQESHVALIEGTYNSGTYGFKHEVLHTIRNLIRVS